MNHFPTTEELEKMSIEQIRSLYPQSPQEEVAMQAVLDKKRVNIPIVDMLDRTDVPDIRTPQDEFKWQKVLDERQRTIDVRFKGEAFLEKELADLEKQREELGFEEDVPVSQEAPAETVPTGTDSILDQPGGESPTEEVKVEEPKIELKLEEKVRKVHCEECGSKSPAFHKVGCSKRK